MKLSQILKIAGAVVGAVAGVILIIKLLGAVLQHPILDILVILGALAYFAGVWFKKHEKK